MEYPTRHGSNALTLSTDHHYKPRPNKRVSESSLEIRLLEEFVRFDEHLPDHLAQSATQAL